ncbi:hypothetical protein MPER_09311 [Moniliophthora perniciosa FA553]|nr:hypothetical protein MPER_09311 [Moniliophthora perniciosa FA553]
MFNDVQGVSISGDALNVVHGDQYNGATTIVNRIVRVERPGRTVVKERKRHDTDSEYNQYREIIRGDINKFEQLSSEDDWDWEWKDGKVVWTHFYRRTVHKAHVYGDDKVYTAISYHGRDAKKIWREEFMKWSQADDPAVLLQLFAINRSNVPTLLFHDEWLPMGHLQSKARGTFWESYYLRVYTGAWQNKMSELGNDLWLNSRTGRISYGPRGLFTIVRSLDRYSYFSTKLESDISTLMCYDMPGEKAPAFVLLRASWVLTPRMTILTMPG